MKTFARKLSWEVTWPVRAWQTAHVDEFLSECTTIVHIVANSGPERDAYAVPKLLGEGIALEGHRLGMRAPSEQAAPQPRGRRTPAYVGR